MYKFPEIFNPSQFAGRSLEMICVNANQIYFHFGNRLSICAEMEFEFYDAVDKTGPKFVTIPSLQSDILRLIEQNVESVSVENGDMLLLKFDGGSFLRFLPDRQFESFHVYADGQQITI